MKKLFLILLTCFSLIACWNDTITYKVNCKYSVSYPDTTIIYDTIFNCNYQIYENDTTFIVCATSYKGTNYIAISPGFNCRANTTAPIRIISYKKIE